MYSLLRISIFTIVITDIITFVFVQRKGVQLYVNGCNSLQVMLITSTSKIYYKRQTSICTSHNLKFRAADYIEL